MIPTIDQNITLKRMERLLRRIRGTLGNMKKLGEEIDAHLDYFFEGEELLIIDIDLGMQRIHSQYKEKAIKSLSILSDIFKEDIPKLQEAQKKNDLLSAREILDKIHSGFRYSGTPRLEKIFQILYTEAKRTYDLSRIEELFSLAYAEVNCFEEVFGKMNDD